MNKGCSAYSQLLTKVARLWARLVPSVLVKFSFDQIASLYAEFSDRQALAPSLAKIILLAEQRGGTVSTREAQLAFPFKHRPSSQQVREFFKELELMNYGEVTTVKKTISFTLTFRGRQAPLNPYRRRFSHDRREQKKFGLLTK